MFQRIAAQLRKIALTTVAATAHEQWFIAVMAALVGIYAGLAAGLFSNTIQFFGLALFRTGALFDALSGNAEWRARFSDEMAQADWNLTFLIVGGFVVGIALALDRLATRSGAFLALGSFARRFRLIAALTAAGIGLYYPLIALRIFNQSFEWGGHLPGMLRGAPWPLILFIPALGGFASGWVVRRFTPTHLGHGVTEVLEAVARDGGRIPRRVPFWKGLAAAICAGAGGSVGREGPVVQLGSGVGSAIGQRLGFSRPNLNVLVGCGAAAGISASFNAPIAGAMFALEIILGDFGVRTFSPIVLASVMGTVTSRALLGATAEVQRASYSLVSGVEIIPYAILGLLCGMLSVAYIVTMEQVEYTFHGQGGGKLGERLRRLPPLAYPALGGLGVGAMGLAFPQLLGTGYETMNEALRGELPGTLLAVFCIGKIIATSLTLGSGGQGGSFFPATFIGAMGGGAFGSLIHILFPAHAASKGAYALVGMGAVVAGATLGPLTGIVMLFELTSDYAIIMPLMVACILSTSLVHLLLGGSLYTRKLKEHGILTHRGRDMSLLRSLTVEEAMVSSSDTLRDDVGLAELLRALSGTQQSAIPLLDEGGKLSGIVSLTDVRGVLGHTDSLREAVKASDVASREVATAYLDEDLEMVLQRIEARAIECLAVVDRAEPRRLLGLISRKDILARYERSLRQAGLAYTGGYSD